MFKLSAFYIFFICCCYSLSAQVASKSHKPNVIFVLTDDQRWDALGAAGNPIIHQIALNIDIAPTILAEIINT